MKLISSTDFVIKVNSIEHTLNALTKIRIYANFLKQPLELWMFIPCELVGNAFANWQPLLEPNGDNYREDTEKLIPNFDYSKYKIDSEKYQQAKERCLFEGCEFDNVDIIINNSIRLNTLDNFKYLNIESLVYAKPKLTQTAIKQLEL